MDPIYIFNFSKKSHLFSQCGGGSVVHWLVSKSKT